MNSPLLQDAGPPGDAGAQDEAWNDAGMNLVDLGRLLKAHRRLLLAGPALMAVLAYGVALTLTPTYTAVTTFMPPQASQSAALSAVASLGALANLATGGGGGRNTADQYVALMQSVTVSDRIIDHFDLIKVYKTPLRIDARKALSDSIHIAVGKKDGWISVEADDEDPRRAADIANRYVDELRRLSASLAVTEAQQRRIFFEQQLRQSRDNLARAQQALQGGGVSAGALNAEPRAAVDAFARLKAEATAAEVRLQTLRNSFAEGSTEVRQQQATLAALRTQLARSEQVSDKGGDADYVSRYREFKFQESLFELYARQFELARVDESREGALIQVVDPATPPERRSKPRRLNIAWAALVLTAILLTSVVVLRQSMRHALRRSGRRDQAQ